MAIPHQRAPNSSARAPNIEIITLLQSAGIRSNPPHRQNLIRQLHHNICASLAPTLLYTVNFTCDDASDTCESICDRVLEWATAPADYAPQGRTDVQSPDFILDMHFLYNPNRENQRLLVPLLGTLLGLLCATQSTLNLLLDREVYIEDWNLLPSSEDEITEMYRTMQRKEGHLERLYQETVRVLEFLDESGQWQAYLGYENYARNEEGRLCRVPPEGLWHLLQDMKGYVTALYDMIPSFAEVEGAEGLTEEEEIREALWRGVGGWELADEDSEEDSGDGQYDEGESGEDVEEVEAGDDEERQTDRAVLGCPTVVLMPGRPSSGILRREFQYSNPRWRVELVGPASTLSISNRD